MSSETKQSDKLEDEDQKQNESELPATSEGITDNESEQEDEELELEQLSGQEDEGMSEAEVEDEEMGAYSETETRGPDDGSSKAETVEGPMVTTTGHVRDGSILGEIEEAPVTLRLGGERRHTEEDDFGQAALLAAKRLEEEARRHATTWGSEYDEDIEEDGESRYEGGMQDLLGRTAAKKDESKDKDKEDPKRMRKNRSKVTSRIHDGKKHKSDESTEPPWTEPSYDATDFISGPIVTLTCTLNPGILKFYQSYGYDCLRAYNLHVMDEDTLIYITGNYLHFYKISEEQVTSVRRSASGYGIGHVAIHPSRHFYAVAEKGDFPLIVVYTWPGQQVHRVLRRGTERGYAYVNFSPTGELLCSQGMEPDYLLTIWNWETERILLHYKAFSQDIYRATFSATHPGHLTTCGVGHIRFWKMAPTFTGLKLQGTIGRFGKTEISDVQGYAGLTDGKVVSSSEWGNLLVWDGGLIVAEIGQKNGKNCHDNTITDILLLETGELLTVGLDGYLKLWESEVIDIADTIVDDTGKYEVEPIHELKLSTVAKPVSVVRRMGDDESAWFIQDGWGKVWTVSIGQSMKDTEYTPNSIFYCPGGAINAISLATMYTMMVVGTSTGHLWLMEYLSKQVLAKTKYLVAITKLIWLPARFDPSGVTLLASFGDGTVRLFVVQREMAADEEGEQKLIYNHPGDSEEGQGLPFALILRQILRFHKLRVNDLKLDEETGVLYSCGDDRVIFASKVELDEESQIPKIMPLGYVTAPFPVISLDLHPIKDYRLVIASRGGRVAECRKPIWGQLDSEISYNQGKLHGRRWSYKSVKSSRRREERRAKRKLELETKLAELKLDIADRRSKGSYVEEEVEVNRLVDQYRRAQLLEDEAALYIPENPCPVYAIYYCINKAIADPSMSRNFFVLVGGHDAGYIYECKCSRPEPGGFHAVPPTPPFENDVAIRCFITSQDNNYLIFGMEDGTIRVHGRYAPPPPPPPTQQKEAPAKTVTAPEVLSNDSRRVSLANQEDDEFSDFSMLADETKFRKKKKKLLPPFPATFFPYDLTNFVCLPMHDPNRGPVTELGFSFDGNFLFSVAEDGSIFSYHWDPNGTFSREEFDPEKSITLPEEVGNLEPIEDSQDPNALTLEEQKQKAEQDRIWNLAEGKKEVLRKKIRELKSKFRFLLQKNNELLEEFRVPRSRFEIDPAIREPKKRRLVASVEEVYRHYEWQSAKSIIAMEKIHKHFFSEIETFHTIVKDISHKTQVHTFRHRILTPEFEQLLARNQTELTQEDIQQKAEQDTPFTEHTVKPIQVTRVHARELIGDFEGKKYDTRTLHQIRTLEDRLQKRYLREIEWAELNAQKIPDDYEDKEDVLAISRAEENLGDYKLKTADDYLGEKVSTTVRRQRVLDMKLRIYDQIKTFNRYVMELREEKCQILEECRDLERELKKVQRQLPPDLQKPIPPIYDMEACEEPEKQFEITRDMIEARLAKKIDELGLTARRQRQLEILREEEEERVAIEEGQLEALQLRRQKAFRRKIKKNVPATGGPPVPGRPQYPGKTGHPDIYKEHQSTVKARKAFFKPKTVMANIRLEMTLQFRCFHQDNLLKKLNKLITYFHDRVEKIRDERVSLQVDVLLMSIKMLNLIQELDIVKEFDSTEKSIMERLNAQKVETDQAKSRLDRVRRRLQRATTEYNNMEMAIQDVQKDVASLIGEKQKFSDYLWKVYKKKIRLDNAGEDDSDQNLSKMMSSSSSSTGDSTDSTSQDSGSDLFKMPKQKLDTNICPEQLDPIMYDKVCELRGKRTQLEIEAEAHKKVLQKVERDYAEVEKIYNKYTGRLEGIGEEVHIVQKKKQARMNDLPCLVILKADQVQCLDDDEFDELSGGIVQKMRHNFPDISQIVLFPKDGIGKLDTRIEELKLETKEERDKHKRARHMMIRLREELNKVEKEVGQIQGRCKREMLAKFGRLVDLDDVCAAIINLEILDELLRLESRRNWHYRERKKIADEIEKARDRLTFLTKENSENNTLLAILIERQRDVEYFLYQQTKVDEEEKKKQQQQQHQLQRTGEGESGKGLQPSQGLMSMTTKGRGDFFGRTDIDLISNEDALEELFNLEDILIRQETRIMILREAIAACKFKSGLPPLIPLRSVKDDVASNFMTASELFALRERRNFEVETLYMGRDVEHIQDSNSRFPSFASPMESATWGVSQNQRHTKIRDDSHNGHRSNQDNLVLKETEEENLDEGDNDDDDEDDDEAELFDTEYKPRNDDQGIGRPGADEESSYPLNIIPDDQMPNTTETDSNPLNRHNDQEEEDPIPVTKEATAVSFLNDEEEEEGEGGPG